MDDIRAVFSPLLLITYVLGTRIIEFPAGEPRPWCSFLYTLLLWSIYYILLEYTTLYFVLKTVFTFQLCFYTSMSTTLLSVILEIYHDKKYRTCMRKLAVIDKTLEEIGIMTDYQKLYTKMLLTVFGCCVYIILMNSVQALCYTDWYSTIYAFYMCFIFEYFSYINLLNDLIIISILGYIELKFDQLNKYIQTLEQDNKHEMKRTWGHCALISHQTRYGKFTNSEYITWIVMYYENSHLHLELCKISRELNSIFGLQMTIKMAVYFVFILTGFGEFFNAFFIINYSLKKALFFTLIITFLCGNTFKIFVINYMCEKVSAKANATGNDINKISYSINDGVVRENVSQFLLQIKLKSLKFYGLGLFQFGLTFFYGFSTFVSTVIVIFVQSHINK